MPVETVLGMVKLAETSSHVAVGTSITIESLDLLLILTLQVTSWTKLRPVRMIASALAVVFEIVDNLGLSAYAM
jgi:hypothetical protein